jgi:serine/threonine protein kinase
MSTRCGTKGYYAPEIVRREPFGVGVDVWSLGVVLFALLTTVYPFDPKPNPVSDLPPLA